MSFEELVEISENLELKYMMKATERKAAFKVACPKCCRLADECCLTSGNYSRGYANPHQARISAGTFALVNELIKL